MKHSRAWYGVAIAVACVLLAAALLGLTYSRRTNINSTLQNLPNMTDSNSQEVLVIPTQDVNFGESSGSVSVGKGRYRNDTQLSASYMDYSVSIGLKNGPLSDQLYLNLISPQASQNAPIGFYVSCDFGTLLFCENTPVSSADSLCQNFLICDRFYDSIIPSEYMNDVSFGIAWTDNALNTSPNGKTTLHIRAFNLATGEMAGIYRSEIIHDSSSNMYKLADLYSADAVLTGELSAQEKTNITEQAISFAEGHLDITVQSDWKKVARKGAIVEAVSAPYFGRFLDAEGKTSLFAQYSTCTSTYAVTIPAANHDYLTVYFAPFLQIIGLNNATAPGESDMNLQIYGYDPTFVRSAASCFMPRDFLKQTYEPVQ